MTAFEYQTIRLRKWFSRIFLRPTSHTTINNYFTISSNHEPSRIARDVVDKIAEARRFPVQSRHVKNPSGTT